VAGSRKRATGGIQTLVGASRPPAFGWGKSFVYFIATKPLREAGKWPIPVNFTAVKPNPADWWKTVRNPEAEAGRFLFSYCSPP
jgi:hypothetical protein